MAINFQQNPLALIIEDDEIAIKDTEEAFEDNFMTVSADALLDDVLVRMLKHKRHLAIVKENKQFVGLITLEDIIEEIIQQEIEDEDDD